MAIYDEDTVAMHEVGKLYDEDGVAMHQIGAVYDEDGASMHLIYKSEYNAMADTWTAYSESSTGGNFAYINTQAQKSITLPDGAYGFTSLVIPVDLSQYSKMTISFSHSGSYSFKEFGFSTVVADASDMNLVKLYHGEDSASYTDIVYDLSPYSQTTAFFKMYMYDGSGAGGNTNFAITKLIFE